MNSPRFYVCNVFEGQGRLVVSLDFSRTPLTITILFATPMLEKELGGDIWRPWPLPSLPLFALTTLSPMNTKTHKQNFHGIVPALSRDCPGTIPAFSSDFLGILFMCFPFSPGKRETHKQFDPHPFPGQSREVVYVYWFFCPPKFVLQEGQA